MIGQLVKPKTEPNTLINKPIINRRGENWLEIVRVD